MSFDEGFLQELVEALAQINLEAIFIGNAAAILQRVRIGKRFVWLAALEDIIAAKEVAGRPKDKAMLLILKETLRIQKAIVEKKKTNRRK